MVAHGPWILFSTANLDPLGHPIFAMLVVGPGEGGLVREPVGGQRDPIVRLSDERPATVAAMRVHRHFARDPHALYQFNRVMEELFDEVLLGTPSALEFQDGIAVSSHIPTVFGFHGSMIKFKECQERGQIHGHGGYSPLVRGLSLEEIQRNGDAFVEEWMRAVMHFVQWSQFTCGQHTARAMGIPEEDTLQYRMEMNERDTKDNYWHRRFSANVHYQVKNPGKIGDEAGKARQQDEDDDVARDKEKARVSAPETVCGLCDTVYEAEFCPQCVQTVPHPDDLMPVEPPPEESGKVTRFVRQPRKCADHITSMTPCVVSIHYHSRVNPLG